MEKLGEAVRQTRTGRPAMIDTLLSLFEAPALRTVAPGAASRGSRPGRWGALPCCGGRACRGMSSRTRRCPGVAIAFLLGGRSPVLLILGGAVAGWVALVLVGVIDRRSRVPTDAALGGTLAVFFGLGLALMHSHPEARAGCVAASARSVSVRPGREPARGRPVGDRRRSVWWRWRSSRWRGRN